MFQTQELARQRMQDRMRQAEAERRSKAIKGQRETTRPRVRRAPSGVFAMILQPLRH